MSNCLDEKIGALLHAYELGVLDDEQEQAFETHLLQCAYCWNELKNSHDVTQLIRGDPRVRQAINRAAEGDESAVLAADPTQTPPSRLRSSRLPLYAAAAMILLLLYPAYLGIVDRGNPSIMRTELVTLLPTRSLTLPAVHRASGDDVTLTFLYPGAVPGERYAVAIRDESGQVIFSDAAFGPFSESGTAHLLLRLKSLPDGDYRLTIGDPETPAQEYTFRITR